MTDSDLDSAGETLPLDGASRSDGSTDPVEAGLRAVFETHPGEASGGSETSAHESIVQRLGEITGEVSRVSLRDILDDRSPIVRPRTAEEGDLPERVGRYRLTGEIARGGVGAVYRAHDVDLGRDVAFKVILDAHRTKPELLRRFVEEAQIGGQLHHPGVCAVHEMGLFADDRPFFTMKLVKGRTLSELLSERRDPAVERQRFLGIFLQVAQTLAYAHARGVIHRDLKPSNIMVGSFGEVQVMDWGLAKVLARGGAQEDRRATTTAEPPSVIRTLRSGSTGSESLAGSVLGTPAYMAPEQARGEVDDLDERTDVFGLGAVLCEILTGRPVHLGDSVEDVYRKAKSGHLDDAFARLDRSSADATLIALAKRCIAFERLERPRNAGAVAAETGAYLDSLEERAQTMAIRAAKARFKTGIAVLAIGVLLLVTGGYLWIENEREARRDTLTEQIDAGLERAQNLRFESAPGGREAIAKLESAIEIVEQSVGLAEDPHGPPDALRRAVSLRGELELALRNGRMLTTLDDIRAASLKNVRSVGRWWVIHRRYREAFGEFGIDLLAPSVSVDEAVAFLRESELPRIALTLDYWLWVLRAYGADPQHREKLRRVVDALEGEESIATRLRAEWARLGSSAQRSVGDELLRLARSRELETAHPQTLGILGHFLFYSNAPEDAERVLRAAWSRHPGDFLINFALGFVLASSDPPRHVAALEYLRAAVAIDPSSAAAWTTLYGALLGTGDVDRALRALVKALRLEQTSRPLYEEVMATLEDAPTVPRSEGFNDVIRFLAELVDSTSEFDSIVARSYVLACSINPEIVGSARAIEIAREEVERTMRRDSQAFYFLARILFASGRRTEAVAALEDALELGASKQRHWARLETYRAAVRPDLVTYASIDAKLEDRTVLIGAGETWRYFKGDRANPEGWERPQFDDSDWTEGKSGFGYDTEGEYTFTTNLADMQGEYTTLSVRRRFELTARDFERFRGFFLSLRSDDGFVAWLNGQEVVRRRAGERQRPVESSDVASSSYEATDVEVFELPRDLLESGENVLAIQGLNRSLDSSDFLLVPQLVAELRRGEERDRFDAFHELLRSRGENDALRARYLEARFLQRDGELERAAEIYRELVEHDRSQAEPHLRLWECLKAQDSELARRRFRGDLNLENLPIAHLPVVPAQPRAKRPEPDSPLALPIILESSDFFHLDPRVEHAATRWEVREAGTAYDREPVYHVLSDRDLVSVTLPSGLLRPRTTYFWRARHVDANGGVSAASGEVSFTTAEFPFEAVPFDLSGVFNADVVAGPDDPDGNDWFGAVFWLGVDGYDGERSDNPAVRGLPTNRRIGVHRLGDYSTPNVVKLRKADRSVRVEVARGRYVAVRFLVSGAEGDSIVPVTLEYADGSRETGQLPCDDFYDDPFRNDLRGVQFGSTPIYDGMDAWPLGQFEDDNDPAVFEIVVPTDPQRELASFVLEPESGRFLMHFGGVVTEGANDRITCFHLLAATGIRAGD